LINIRAKSKTGQILEIEVERIISIDGEPYTATGSQLRDHLMVIEGRLQSIETIITTQPLAGV
jgi:Fe2+ or Zn2+ uptake regulation protein